jgi:hypothetical protein
MLLGAQSAPYGYVLGVVDFHVPFGRCYWLGGFCMYRSIDAIGGVDFLCTVWLMLFVGCILCIVWLMLFVGCILCIVNVTRCAERTLRVCSWWGKFLMHRSVDVIGGVDF